MRMPCIAPPVFLQEASIAWQNGLANRFTLHVPSLHRNVPRIARDLLIEALPRAHDIYQEAHYLRLCRALILSVLQLNRQVISKVSFELRIGKFRQILGHFAQEDRPDLLAQRGTDYAKRLWRGSYDKAIILAVGQAAVEIRGKRLGEALFLAPVKVVPLDSMACNVRRFVNASGTLGAYFVIGFYVLRVLGAWHFGERRPAPLGEKKTSARAIGNQDIGSDGLHIWPPFL